jgi:tripartite motif-containing protein 71
MILSLSWLRRCLLLAICFAVFVCAGCSSPAQNSTHQNNTITTSATFTPRFLWRLGATADALEAPTGIAVDTQGNVYVADQGNGRVQKFDNTGKRLAIWEKAGQLNRPYAIAVDGQGNVYVADSGHIDKFDANGQLLASWSDPLPYEIIDLKVDGKGNLYVLVSAGTGPDHIQKFDGSGNLLTSWYNGNGGFGIAVDEQGDVYVTDQGPMRVEKYDSHGKLLTWWGGKGNGQGQFSGFLGQGIAVDTQGNVYVHDQNNRIQKFDADRHLLAVWQDHSFPRKFTGITGMALDQQGHLFAASETDNVVYKFDSAGSIVAQFGNDGIGTGDGQMTYPVGVAVDGQGNLYVDDSDRIQKFDSSGRFLTTWHIPELGMGIAVDHQGDVYVMDSSGAHILKYDTNGQLLMQWGSKGSGKGQFDYIEGIAIDGQGNVFILDRNLGVRDPAGHTPRIQKFDSSGRFLTMWGIEQHGYAIAADEQGHVYLAGYDAVSPYLMLEFDGNGRLLTTWIVSKSITAYSFTVDSQGNVYMAGHTSITSNASPYPSTSEGIYKFDNGGRVIGHYDSKGNGNGQFGNIFNIAVDRQGNIYTADFTNRCVQKFQQV